MVGKSKKYSLQMEETKQGYRDKLSQDVYIARVWHMKQKTSVVTSRGHIGIRSV